MKNETETRWLVYRPQQDYDDSLTPYLVCETEAEAVEVVQELQDWMESLSLGLPPRYPELEHRFAAIEEVITLYGIGGTVAAYMPILYLAKEAE